MELSKQCETVLDYINAHPGCTTRDIVVDTSVTYPSNRIAELRKAGAPIMVIGVKRYPDARPFKMYAIREASLDTLPIPGLLLE